MSMIKLKTNKQKCSGLALLRVSLYVYVLVYDHDRAQSTVSVNLYVRYRTEMIMMAYWLLWKLFLLNICQSVSKASLHNKLEVSYDSEGKGYHRDIILTLKGPPADAVNDSCDVCLIVNIPRGIYIDTYQISNLQENGGSIKVYTKDEIDLEKAAHNSKSHLVYLYGTMQVRRNVFQKVIAQSAFEDMPLEAHLSFPLHLRYHKPSGVRSSVNVTLGKPQVLVRCSGNSFHATSDISAPCNSLGPPYCIWNMPQAQFDREQLVFNLPVGRKQDSLLVIIVTLTVTISSSMYFIYIFNTSLPNHAKDKSS